MSTQATEKPKSLHSHLRHRYGSSTQKLVRDFERTLHKKARIDNHHIFNLRCRDEGAIPASLRIKPPVRTREGYKIAERASRAFLRARVRESYRKKREHLLKLGRITAKLEEELDTVDYTKVARLSRAAAEKTHAECKQKHVRKLDALLSRSKKKVELRPEGQARWVVNLSKRALTSSQEEVLKKGLNFAPVPTSFPLQDIIAGTEEAARKLPEDDAQDLRMRVCGILRSSKLPKDNITKSQRVALKEMKGWGDQVILAADKGNATVVMERSDYDGKVRELLGDTTTYRRLPKDPTQAQETKLSRRLRELQKNREITTPIYNRLRPTGSGPNPLGFMAYPRSISHPSHLDPLSHA